MLCWVKTRHYKQYNTITQQLIYISTHWIPLDTVLSWTHCKASVDCALPGWICNSTDIEEWLHTGSRRSTRATELIETLYMNGNSGMGNKTHCQISRKWAGAHCVFAVTSNTVHLVGCVNHLEWTRTKLYGTTQAVFFKNWDFPDMWQNDLSQSGLTEIMSFFKYIYSSHSIYWTALQVCAVKKILLFVL